MLNTNAGTSFWSQTHQSVPKIETSEPTPIQQVDDRPDILCPVTNIIAKGKGRVEVIEFPNGYNHLRLEICTDTQTWHTLYEPILQGTNYIDVPIPDKEFLLRWIGVHPEKGDKESAIFWMNNTPAVIEPPDDVPYPQKRSPFSIIEGNEKQYFDSYGKKV